MNRSDDHLRGDFVRFLFLSFKKLKAIQDLSLNKIKLLIFKFNTLLQIFNQRWIWFKTLWYP